MSDFTVLLDSSKTGQLSDNFEVNFNSPINLHGIPHEVALKNLSTWFSWFNVNAEYGNNEFRYSHNGGTNWNIATIPPGNYSISQLETAIHDLMKVNTHFTSTLDGDVFDINFLPNYSTLKLYVQLTNSYQVDFSHGNLYRLLGFASAVLSASAYGPNNVNITNDLSIMNLKCSLISGGSFDNGQSSDILFPFLPTVPPGSNIDISPVNPTYTAVNRFDSIDRIRLTLTDNLNRRINLNGEHLTAFIHIRPRKLLKYKDL